MPLIIETYLAESKGKGIGLFAGRDIRPGEVIYVDDPNFDRIFPMITVNRMPEVQRKFVISHGSYISSIKSYYLCADNAKFFNHSNNPNTQYRDEKVTALYDITKGTELTADYREFCDDCWRGDFGFEIIK